MNNPEKETLLARGVAVSGTGSQWTLLGATETDAAETVRSARGASARLNAWSTATLASADEVEVVTVERIAAAPPAPAKKARQVTGVSKALSPENRQR